jgi:CBS domain-containing protein
VVALWIRGKMEKRISNLLKGRRKPFTISPEATVYSALEIMAEHDIGFLVVMSGTSMLGVISERDYARKVDLFARDSRSTRVSEIMNTNIFSVDSERTYDEAMELMTRKNIRHLPVVKSNKLVAIISLSDVVKACLRNQKETIDFLEDLALDK